mmetsp:Transcript_169150/g.543729  ORF Transcript_169150/g.543729 Transcript_169150/m.543729 type:complete len:108 (-) Transcript_169150:158-481(-)
MGIAVSRVLKYTDAVAKTVVGSLRDVAIVFFAPHVVMATRFDSIAVGSACLVGIAGMIYSVPPAKEATPGTLGSTGAPLDEAAARTLLSASFKRYAESSPSASGLVK